MGHQSFPLARVAADGVIEAAFVLAFAVGKIRILLVVIRIASAIRVYVPSAFVVLTAIVPDGADLVVPSTRDVVAFVDRDQYVLASPVPIGISAHEDGCLGSEESEVLCCCIGNGGGGSSPDDEAEKSNGGLPGNHFE